MASRMLRSAAILVMGLAAVLSAGRASVAGNEAARQFIIVIDSGTWLRDSRTDPIREVAQLASASLYPTNVYGWQGPNRDFRAGIDRLTVVVAEDPDQASTCPGLTPMVDRGAAGPMLGRLFRTLSLPGNADLGRAVSAGMAIETAMRPNTPCLFRANKTVADKVSDIVHGLYSNVARPGPESDLDDAVVIVLTKQGASPSSKFRSDDGVADYERNLRARTEAVLTVGRSRSALYCLSTGSGICPPQATAPKGKGALRASYVEVTPKLRAPVKWTDQPDTVLTAGRFGLPNGRVEMRLGGAQPALFGQVCPADVGLVALSSVDVQAFADEDGKVDWVVGGTVVPPTTFSLEVNPPTDGVVAANGCYHGILASYLDRALRFRQQDETVRPARIVMTVRYHLKALDAAHYSATSSRTYQFRADPPATLPEAVGREVVSTTLTDALLVKQVTAGDAAGLSEYDARSRLTSAVEAEMQRKAGPAGSAVKQRPSEGGASQGDAAAAGPTVPPQSPGPAEPVVKQRPSEGGASQGDAAAAGPTMPPQSPGPAEPAVKQRPGEGGAPQGDAAAAATTVSAEPSVELRLILAAGLAAVIIGSGTVLWLHSRRRESAAKQAAESWHPQFLVKTEPAQVSLDGEAGARAKVEVARIRISPAGVAGDDTRRSCLRVILPQPALPDPEQVLVWAEGSDPGGRGRLFFVNGTRETLIENEPPGEIDIPVFADFSALRDYCGPVGAAGSWQDHPFTADLAVEAEWAACLVDLHRQPRPMRQDDDEGGAVVAVKIRPLQTGKLRHRVVGMVDDRDVGPHVAIVFGDDVARVVTELAEAAVWVLPATPYSLFASLAKDKATLKGAVRVEAADGGERRYTGKPQYETIKLAGEVVRPYLLAGRDAETTFTCTVSDGNGQTVHAFDVVVKRSGGASSSPSSSSLPSPSSSGGGAAVLHGPAQGVDDDTAAEGTDETLLPPVLRVTPSGGDPILIGWVADDDQPVFLRGGNDAPYEIDSTISNGQCSLLASDRSPFRPYRDSAGSLTTRTVAEFAWIRLPPKGVVSGSIKVDFADRSGWLGTMLEPPVVCGPEQGEKRATYSFPDPRPLAVELNLGYLNRCLQDKREKPQLGDISITLTPKFTIGGIGLDVKPLVMTMPMGLPPLVSNTALCIDFGTSAIVAYQGPARKAAKDTGIVEHAFELQSFQASETPGGVSKSIADYLTGAWNPEARSSHLLPSIIGCRLAADATESYAEQPGFPGFRSTEVPRDDHPDSIHLPADSEDYGRPETLIYSLKGWLGASVTTIPVASREIDKRKVATAVFARIFGYLAGIQFDTLRRIVLTHPNTFTDLSRLQLRTVAKSAFTTAMEARLIPSQSVKDAQIVLLSESDAVLATYIDKHRTRLLKPGAPPETVMVFDMGAGTLDLTLSQIRAEGKQLKITMVNRLGVQVAGNYLDSCLARLAHRLLTSAGFARKIAEAGMEYRFPIVSTKDAGLDQTELIRRVERFVQSIRDAKQGHDPAVGWDGQIFCLSLGDETDGIVVPKSGSAGPPESVFASITDPKNPPEREEAYLGYSVVDRRVWLCIPRTEIDNDPRIAAYLEFVARVAVNELVARAGMEEDELQAIVPSGRACLWPPLQDLMVRLYGSRWLVGAMGAPADLKEAVARGGLLLTQMTQKGDVAPLVVTEERVVPPALGIILTEDRFVPRDVLTGEGIPGQAGKIRFVQTPILVAEDTIRSIDRRKLEHHLFQDIAPLANIDVESSRVGVEFTEKPVSWEGGGGDPLYEIKIKVVNFETKQSVYDVRGARGGGTPDARPPWPIGTLVLEPDEWDEWA